MVGRGRRDDPELSCHPDSDRALVARGNDVNLHLRVEREAGYPDRHPRRERLVEARTFGEGIRRGVTKATVAGTGFEPVTFGL